MGMRANPTQDATDNAKRLKQEQHTILNQKNKDDAVKGTLSIIGCC